MHVYEKNDLKMTSLYIIFEAGSMLETTGRYGTMHLMEHMICKNYNDMRDTLQELGIVSNAYTSDSVVVFWFKGLESKLSPIKSHLVKLITGGFKSTDEELQMEKKVVVEEYLDTFNDQIIGNFYNSMRKLYGYNGAIGLRSDIESFSIDDAHEVYNKYFTKPTRIVEVGPTVSDFSFVEYSESIDYSFNDFNIRGCEMESVNANNKLSVVAIGKMKCNTSDFSALMLGMSMLGDGLNSPLYKEIRETRGLSYFSWATCQEYGNFGLPLFGSCTEKNRIDDLMDVYRTVIGNVQSYLTEERFNICKNRSLVILEKRNVLRFDNPEDLINGNNIYQFHDLESLTYEKVKCIVVKYITLENIEFVVC